MTAIIGDMPMPAGFRYADVYKRGKPYHGTPNRLDTYDIFYLRHPPDYSALSAHAHKRVKRSRTAL